MTTLLLIYFIVLANRMSTSDSLGAWGIFFSAVAAAAAILTLQRDKRLRYEDKRTEQASKVAFWTESKLEASSISSRTDLFVSNGSDAPIYQLVFPAKQQLNRDSMGMMRKALIKPGVSLITTDRSIKLISQENFSIEFMDAKGIYWKRDVEGNLTETEPTKLWDFHPDDLR